ncbi:MAG: DUF3160 domain-containing protein [Candidatus Asgardarchaeia archaeon]
MFRDKIERMFLYPLNEIKKKSSIAASSAAALAILIVLIVWYLSTPYYINPPNVPSGNPLIIRNLNTYGLYYFRTNVEEIDVKVGNVSQYALPLNPEEIENFQIFADMGFSEDVINKLLENGFVVTFYSVSIENLADFVEYYKNLPENMPRFVTSDMMLHVFHSLFASLLMNSEENYFIPWLNETLKTLLIEVIKIYTNNPQLSKILAEAIIRLIAYLIVPIKLLDPNYQLPANTPSQSISLANLELTNIQSHAGIATSPIMKHEEDYTQYIPRGYYTVNENLTRYFLAAMYLGRMYFPVFSALNSTFADVATAAAMILTNLVYNTRVPTIEGNPTALEIYERIYYTTAFFVGYSDDLTFYDYYKVIKSIFGDNATYLSFADVEKLHEAENLLINLSQSKISAVGQESILVIGLLFMGQRFIMDPYIFQKLVHPAVPDRLLPSVLDIAAAFGSQRAKYYLKDAMTMYPDYSKALDNVSKEVKSLNLTAWTWNLYNGWLYTINSTLRNNYEGYPTFMSTDAWKDEKLNTFAASWSELRHDTILYAKQSYTKAVSIVLPPSGEGFVEPIPLLWSRLKGLTLQMKIGLSELGLLPDFFREKLDFLYNELDFLLNISIKELMRQPLNETEENHIFNFGESLEFLMLGLKRVHQKTTIIADVHTDPNLGLVLEEGVGYIHLIAVVFPTSDGNLKIALGPVFSHFEFTQPMTSRLTDEAWATMLSQGTTPQYPEWTSSYLVLP